MKQRNVRELLVTKRDALIEVAMRKRRHKTEEEKNRYNTRYEKAKDYLGELAIVYSILSRYDFFAKSVNDEFVSIVKKSHGVDTLFEGEYVRLYKQLNNGDNLLITSSVSKIANFQ